MGNPGRSRATRLASTVDGDTQGNAASTLEENVQAIERWEGRICSPVSGQTGAATGLRARRNWRRSRCTSYESAFGSPRTSAYSVGFAVRSLPISLPDDDRLAATANRMDELAAPPSQPRPQQLVRILQCEGTTPCVNLSSFISIGGADGQEEPETSRRKAFTTSWATRSGPPSESQRICQAYRQRTFQRNG
jgi:hypothetical protein